MIKLSPRAVSDNFDNNLNRYCEELFESASLLHALIYAPDLDGEYSELISSTRDFQINKYMHNFCFNLRRSIELSNQINPKIPEQAKALFLKKAEMKVEVQTKYRNYEITICNKDVEWISNRIIHSHLAGLAGFKDESMGKLALLFQSDYDGETIHCIDIADFVETCATLFDEIWETNF